MVNGQWFNASVVSHADRYLCLRCPSRGAASSVAQGEAKRALGTRVPPAQAPEGRLGPRQDAPTGLNQKKQQLRDTTLECTNDAGL